VPGKETERWRELCEQASREQDSEKLLKLVGELVGEIDRLHDEKQRSEMQNRHAKPKAS